MMIMALNERSVNNLKGVHVDLVKVVELAASRVPFIVTEGLRNLERQRQLVAAKKSWTLDSRHLSGHAVDVVDPDGKYDIPDMDHIAVEFKKAAKELGIPIVWGGDWKQRDTPHFELDRKAYPASGISLSQKAKEIATKVVTSRPVLTAGGAAAGGGAAVSTDSVPVPAPSLPSPPDASWFSNWKGFGTTVVDLGSWAWTNPLITIGLAAWIGAVMFWRWRSS
jgi:peptidoglycan L-alanyl-D-glutamate endopeptidase CwlK